jgi:hypothetical protein
MKVAVFEVVVSQKPTVSIIRVDLSFPLIYAMMQAKESSEKSAVFYRTSRRQIPQLVALFKSSSQN